MRQGIGRKRTDDPIGSLRALPRPDPPPWLRDRIMAQVYAIEGRRRLLRTVVRYGTAGIAMLLWGAGTICLSWAITH